MRCCCAFSTIIEFEDNVISICFPNCIEFNIYTVIHRIMNSIFDSVIEVVVIYIISIVRNKCWSKWIITRRLNIEVIWEECSSINFCIHIIHINVASNSPIFNNLPFRIVRPLSISIVCWREAHKCVAVHCIVNGSKWIKGFNLVEVEVLCVEVRRNVCSVNTICALNNRITCRWIFIKVISNSNFFWSWIEINVVNNKSIVIWNHCKYECTIAWTSRFWICALNWFWKSRNFNIAVHNSWVCSVIRNVIWLTHIIKICKGVTFNFLIFNEIVVSVEVSCKNNSCVINLTKLFISNICKSCSTVVSVVRKCNICQCLAIEPRTKLNRVFSKLNWIEFGWFFFTFFNNEVFTFNIFIIFFIIYIVAVRVSHIFDAAIFIEFIEIWINVNCSSLFVINDDWFNKHSCKCITTIGSFIFCCLCVRP